MAPAGKDEGNRGLDGGTPSPRINPLTRSADHSLFSLLSSLYYHRREIDPEDVFMKNVVPHPIDAADPILGHSRSVLTSFRPNPNGRHERHFRMLPRWCLTAGCLAFLARTQASQARCDIPSWVVKTLNVTYSDEQNGGRSTLVLVDTTTNATETLTFEVIFNVIGVLLDSTPNNTALDARLNFQISEVTVQVNQTWSCADTPSFA